MVKSPLASARDRRDAGSIPGLERSPGEGSGRILKPTPVFLHGESYGQRSLAGYTVHGVAGVGHNLATKSPPPWFFQ